MYGKITSSYSQLAIFLFHSIILPDGRLQNSPPIAGTAFRCYCAHVDPGRVVRDTFDGQRSVRIDR